MIEKIKHLRVLLPCDQFVLTGSLALHYMGLCPKPNDIDIILVNPTEESKNILKRLSEENPAETQFNYPGQKGYIFMLDGTKIDVFFSEKKRVSKVNVDGIDISNIPDIVRAKKSYGRIKDWIQMRKTSRVIFKEEEFTNFLNKQDYVGSKD